MASSQLKNPFLILMAVIYAAYTSRRQQDPLMADQLSRSALAFLEASRSTQVLRHDNPPHSSHAIAPSIDIGAIAVYALFMKMNEIKYGLFMPPSDNASSVNAETKVGQRAGGRAGQFAAEHRTLRAGFHPGGDGRGSAAGARMGRSGSGGDFAGPCSKTYPVWESACR
jgi:hypothetical protein